MATTVLEEVLLALIPYTKQNLALTYQPKKFFYDLEKRSDLRRQSIQQAYWRAKREGFIEDTDNRVDLTAKGISYLEPLQAKPMLGGVSLMVVFDIPERLRVKRTQLRTQLRQLNFSHVQKSVWTSGFDHEETLRKVIRDLNIIQYVEIYDCSKR